MQVADVSVVVPAYNAESFITDALDGLAAQRTMPTEVVIVDDGSRDATARVIQAWADAHSTPFELRLVRQPNGGISRARNAAIEHSRCAWIAMLDSDDIWLPNHLEELFQAMAVLPDAVAAYGAGQVFEGSDIQTVPYDDYWDSPSKTLGKAVAGSHVLRIDRSALPRLLRGNFIKPTSLLVRRQALDTVGRFNEKLATAEDRELLVRLLMHGEFAYTPVSVSLYRTHAHNATHDRHAKRNQETGLLAIAQILAAHERKLTPAEREAATRTLSEASDRYLALCASEGWRSLGAGRRFLLTQVLGAHARLPQKPKLLLKSLAGSVRRSLRRS